MAAALGQMQQQQRAGSSMRATCTRHALPRTVQLAAAARSQRRPQQQQQRRRRLVAAGATLQETAAQPVMDKGELTQFPEQPAVYAVYDKDGGLQYIGLTRKVSVSVSNHLRDLPQQTAAVKFEAMPDAGRDELTGAWKAWMEEALAEGGQIPPGNAPGETKWQSRAGAAGGGGGARPRADIRLTAGKAISVPIETLVDQVVKSVPVVAFVKGTRSQPQCGFSYKMLSLLNEAKADYEVVNVLDDFHNPGLREAIKAYSQWPTIPQLYVGGEFVGGADIVEQMAGTGELGGLLAAAAAKQGQQQQQAKQQQQQQQAAAAT